MQTQKMDSRGNVWTKCPHCAFTVPGNVLLCTNCGNNLNEKPEQFQRPNFDLSRFVEHWENLCGAALILFFFMPWISLGGVVTIPGYKIPELARGLGALVELGTGKATALPLPFYLVYVIPVSAAAAIMADLAGYNGRPLSAIAGTAPFVLLLIGGSKIGADVFKAMGIGAWLTLLAATTMILVLFDVIGFKDRFR